MGQHNVGVGVSVNDDIVVIVVVIIVIVIVIVIVVAACARVSPATTDSAVAPADATPALDECARRNVADGGGSVTCVRWGAVLDE
jgi:hypothetical protein